MSKRDERLKFLLDVIQKQDGISIRDLALAAGVSEITVRRDIGTLVDRGLARNLHGTVFYNDIRPRQDDYLLYTAANLHRAEKKRIGAYAASIIRKGEFVIIDNGSTTEHLAASIPYDAEMSVLCYNMNVLNNLYTKPGIDLIFCGGRFHQQTLMFESPESLEIIRRFRASKAFVSVAGVHETFGVTCCSEYELANKLEIIKTSVEKILLTDSSKFGKVEPCFVGDLTVFDRIITDRGLSEEWRERIRAMDIELTTV